MEPSLNRLRIRRFTNTLPVIFTLWLISSAPSAGAQSVTKTIAGSVYQLSFSDSFDQLNLSPSGGGSYSWYKGIWWEDEVPSDSLITTSDSVLTLTWERSSTPDTSITTFAHDRTGGHTWRYGYFEARMKWKPVSGAWPAFWLIPRQAAVGAEETGEIDVFEGQGNMPHTFYGTVHDWIGKSDSANYPNWVSLPNAVDFSTWHTYGLLWTPGKVTWYFDDKPLYSAPTPQICDQQDFFIVLGSQEGAKWDEGNLSGVSADKLELQVDWVKVWQQ